MKLLVDPVIPILAEYWAGQIGLLQNGLTKTISCPERKLICVWRKKVECKKQKSVCLDRESEFLPFYVEKFAFSTGKNLYTEKKGTEFVYFFLPKVSEMKKPLC
jgi:hypothetical protein